MVLKKAGDGVSSDDGPLEQRYVYVMLVWPLCEHSSFMMAFWPLSQIRRLCVQLVGVLRLRCPHGVFMFLGGPC